MTALAKPLPIDLADPHGAGRWGKALAGVLALHLAIVMVAVYWQGAKVRSPREEMAVSLDLAPLPIAQDVESPAPEAAAAAAQPVVQERPVPVEKVQPVAQPETPLPVVAPPVPVPVRVAVAAAPATEAPASSDPPGAAADAGAATGSAAQVAPHMGARGHGGGRGGGDAAAAWRGRVLTHLHRHKRYPPAARMMKREGRVQVNLTLDRHGRVLAVAVSRGAGFKPLDEEAVDVVRRAQPLPPPPPEVEGDAIPMLVPIGFSLRGI